MSDGFWIALMTEHGPWALLVFWLLFRDQKKDEGARAALNRNTEIIVELTTLIRERLPQKGS
ncbi:MAG: hypothetical protein ABNH26_15355 [Celeribacter sp.]|jgi:hypothetical protein|uniref:Uncharacterized protein n=1 Tax=Pacificitalea manganoxidans TaxID=1411902 RepID=A0A291M005_9RHOB|nr:hypothetical protein [Pacificitalea manganoxidans]ATI42234.1 hypothetical protein CBW24_09560 [Pacificitalea manganoxidans]MDR6307949.1 hypothetical protein [Pacificitalea manganoxidans]OWU72036.1 hypothetical protein ATO2_01745 [Roseovarius sp. 22II1-1F6A]